MRAPHRLGNQNSQRNASRVPELQDGDLQRRDALMQLMEEVLPERGAESIVRSTCGCGKQVDRRALSAPCSAEIWHCVSSISTEICP